MSVDRSTDPLPLLIRLEDCRALGLTLLKAKAALIAEGFSEVDITRITDQFPYDALEGTDEDARIKATYINKPDEVAAIAGSIAKDYQQQRRQQAALDAVASEAAPDTQSKIEYENRFIDDVGMNWGKWSIISLIIFVISFGSEELLHLPYLIVRLISTALSVAVIVYLIMHA